MANERPSPESAPTFIPAETVTHPQLVGFGLSPQEAHSFLNNRALLGPTAPSLEAITNGLSDDALYKLREAGVAVVPQEMVRTRETVTTPEPQGGVIKRGEKTTTQETTKKGWMGKVQRGLSAVLAPVKPLSPGGKGKVGYFAGAAAGLVVKSVSLATFNIGSVPIEIGLGLTAYGTSALLNRRLQKKIEKAKNESERVRAETEARSSVKAHIRDFASGFAAASFLKYAGPSVVSYVGTRLPDVIDSPETMARLNGFSDMLRAKFGGLEGVDLQQVIDEKTQQGIDAFHSAKETAFGTAQEVTNTGPWREVSNVGGRGVELGPIKFGLSGEHQSIEMVLARIAQSSGLPYEQVIGTLYEPSTMIDIVTQNESIFRDAGPHVGAAVDSFFNITARPEAASNPELVKDAFLRLSDALKNTDGVVKYRLPDYIFGN